MYRSCTINAQFLIKKRRKLIYTPNISQHQEYDLSFTSNVYVHVQGTLEEKISPQSFFIALLIEISWLL